MVISALSSCDNYISGRLLRSLSAGLLALAGTAGWAADTYRYVDLHPAALQGSSAADINNLGQIVGQAATFTFSPTLVYDFRAVVWNAEVPTYLNAYPSSRMWSAASINDAGQIVGRNNGEMGLDTHGVIWNGATSTGLTGWGRAEAINNNGQVVGDQLYSGAPGPLFHAALWTDANTSVDLSQINGHISGRANDINDVGQVVGYSGDDHGNPKDAILWNGTVATVLGPGQANGINNVGQVVGRGGVFPTLWSGGVATSLTAADGTANDINESGQIVGSVLGRAMLWSGGVETDLNSFLDAATAAAGWVLVDASAINDSGWIVGTARNSLTNTSHAYLLAAVPEPSSWALAIVGLCAIGWLRRRDQSAAQVRAA